MIKKYTLFVVSWIFFSADAFPQYTPQELRLGILKHDVAFCGLDHRYEKGYDVNAEILFESPDYSCFRFAFSPRPHLGMSLNTNKGTHQFYLGLTWRIDFLNALFIEATFGGELQTGLIHPVSREKTLGTRFLFRESASLGAQLNDQLSLSVMMDHASNAGITEKNPGITSIGLRCGYRF